MGWGAKGRKLGRDTGERTALFRHLVASLILHDRIETTEAKAKETKKIADGLIDPRARKRLFGEIAPRYQAGRGGYTRVIKTRRRRGDSAPMALVELVSP